MSVAFNVVWYVLHTTKIVDARIPDQGSSLLSNYFVSQAYVLGFYELIIFQYEV